MSMTPHSARPAIRVASWLGSIVLLVLIGGLAIKATNSESSHNGGSSPVTLREGSGGGRLLIRVFVHEFDLYPDLIRVSTGNILLRAENEKQTNISLVVERVAEGNLLKQTARINVPQHVRRAGQELTLAAGEYVFYEQSKPELKGKLIVDTQ